jgi:hypothetical protein
MRVEITLTTGVTVVVQASRFEAKKSTYSGEVNGFSWAHLPTGGVPYLEFIRIESVDAVVCYPDSPDSKAVQDERDGEEAKAGGDQVEPGGDVEGRDAE